MSIPNIAAYAEGIMYPPKLTTSDMEAIKNAGWTSIILGLFHIDTSGNIIYNDQMIVKNEKYEGDFTWPAQITKLKQNSTITTVLASIGGGGVKDFSNIQKIYNNNNNSFAGTSLQKNFKVFKNIFFPTINLIDMDCEDNYDQPSFVAFCEMLIEIGYGITFCPYKEMDFWTDSLSAIQKTYPGAVKWWNLQCYAGGDGNDPSIWATAIRQAIQGFNTDGFILPGDWSRNWTGSYWQGDCPNAAKILFSRFKSESCVGGAFFWTIDQMLEYSSVSKQHPDPDSCGNVDMSSYIQSV